VHDAVHDEFVEKVRAAVERSVRLGDPLVEETTMGPLNNSSTADKTDEHVADAVERGARVVTGGERASGFPTDLYWQATVLADVTDEMEIAREETFGPVVPIVRISSDEEALQIANASPYGLLTAVWTRDLARGLRFAEAVDAGWVNVNESTNYWESHLPFGGRSGKSSGVGRVGGSQVLEAFTEPKTVVLTLGRPQAST
jgi:succinate-semialdehyde dehydrogenase/glutarate-semialdehyde dehydrogenase